MTQKIVFLDIDGPIINASCYYLDKMCSIRRTVMNQSALGYVQRLCQIADAKLVTNSTHNFHQYEDMLSSVNMTLQNDLIKFGIDKEIFHKDWRTKFPNPPGSKFSSSSDHRRMLAINEWMERNGEADWICFDDDAFTDDPRLVVVDFETGIDYFAFRDACRLWEIDISNKDLFV